MARAKINEDILKCNEKGKHKMKKLVPKPNSRFILVKCKDCYMGTTVFDYTKNEVFCSSCKKLLGTPTGGKVRLTEGTRWKFLNSE